MQYSYTVVLQSKQHRPRKFTTLASDIKEVTTRIRQLFDSSYHIRAITRRPR